MTDDGTIHACQKCGDQARLADALVEVHESCAGLKAGVTRCVCDPKTWGRPEFMPAVCDDFDESKATGYCENCGHGRACHGLADVTPLRPVPAAQVDVLAKAKEAQQAAAELEAANAGLHKAGYELGLKHGRLQVYQEWLAANQAGSTPAGPATPRGLPPPPGPRRV